MLPLAIALALLLIAVLFLAIILEKRNSAAVVLTRQVQFPFPRDIVFNALRNSIRNLSGLKIKSVDDLSYRIDAKTSMTPLSWGEFISISVSDNDADAAVVSIGSANKPFLGIAKAEQIDRRNVEQILALTSTILARYGKDWLNDPTLASVPINHPTTLVSSAESENLLRTFIVKVLGWTCLAIIVIPTLISIFVLFFLAYGGQILWGIVNVVLTFLISTFIAGGALTLLDIANNVRKLAQNSLSSDQTSDALTATTDQPSPTQS